MERYKRVLEEFEEIASKETKLNQNDLFEKENFIDASIAYLTSLTVSSEGMVRYHLLS